ncbi:hypothetical protein [Lactiplantibacillus plantarum]
MNVGVIIGDKVSQQLTFQLLSPLIENSIIFSGVL